MTIAIATLYSDGVVVCADTKVVASDGATTRDQKLTVLSGEKIGIFAIADAAEDANAAKMLSSEIRHAASNAKRPTHPEPEIKKVMTSWFRAYSGNQPPHLQFILATVVPPYERRYNASIYLCEPPATVMRTIKPIAIGRGSRAVDPWLRLLSAVTDCRSEPQMTLLRLAYLMRRAKEDEGSACGGETYAVVASNLGAFAHIHPSEMTLAENLAASLDDLLFETLRIVTSGGTEEVHGKFSRETFDTRYREIVESSHRLEFSSLKQLEQLVRDCGCGKA